MRILFIGSLKFSENLLINLIESSENIVGVVSLKSPKYNADFSDISLIANGNNIDSISIDDINSRETISWIRKKSPDIIFCFGWSRLIKKEILDIPKIGIIGYHPSLLPSNKGRHPIIWALALGLKETGSTFFFLWMRMLIRGILFLKKKFLSIKKITLLISITIYKKVPKIKLRNYCQI